MRSVAGMSQCAAFALLSVVCNFSVDSSRSLSQFFFQHWLLAPDNFQRIFFYVKPLDTDLFSNIKTAPNKK